MKKNDDVQAEFVCSIVDKMTKVLADEMRPLLDAHVITPAEASNMTRVAIAFMAGRFAAGAMGIEPEQWLAELAGLFKSQEVKKQIKEVRTRFLAAYRKASIKGVPKQ